MKKNIVCLPGDGIGPEILNIATEVLEFVGETFNHEFTLKNYPFGGNAIDDYGVSLPDHTLEASKCADAVLLGAVGGPKWDSGIERPENGLLKIRKELQLFANLRPVSVSPETSKLSPLKEEILKDVDFTVVRELTGGIYFAQPKRRTDEVATDTLTYERHEIERIVDFAFKLAKKRRNKVTSVDKANVLESSKLWRQVACEVHSRYPEVELEHLYVDAAAMELMRNPRRFDVVVTENLFGDILSDEASMLPGSLGLLPSGSYSTTGPALYEPIHGSAPDIAGKGIANPIGMLRSVSMMLADFGMSSESSLIESSISATLRAGFYTKDLGGNCSTDEFKNELFKELKKGVQTHV
ncbi:MAG: 3-isopropylmalate dehydrogenase [Bacillales bacterium]|jgi:3-isopropylmalate dehydrogenase|nr:3-isopropylmalate dehydrogenase [Bacillales bacterium]